MGEPEQAPASGGGEVQGLAFRLGGIPVLIRPGFFLIPLLGSASSGMERGLAWGAVVLASVLAHELGHALAMRAFGYAPSIELHMLGGLTHFPAGAQPTAGRQMVVTAAGPVVGLLVGGALLLARALLPPLEPAGVAAWALFQAIFVNVGWSLINLLPVLPWDGGLLLEAGLLRVTGKERPRIVSVVSMVAGALVTLFAASRQQMMLGYFGVMGIVNGWQRFSAARRHQRFAEIWRAITSETPAEGERLAVLELARTTDSWARGTLQEFVAWARVYRGDLVGARQALAEMTLAQPSLELVVRVATAERDWAGVVALLEPRLTELRADAGTLRVLFEALIAQGHPERAVALCRSLCEGETSTPTAVHEASAQLFHAKQFEASLTVCGLLFERFGDRVAAVNAACCLARLGRLDEGLGWATRAVDAGYADATHLEADEDLAPLRARPGFAALVERARKKPPA